MPAATTPATVPPARRAVRPQSTASARTAKAAGKRVLFWNTFSSVDLSPLLRGVDHRGLPGELHRYFEQDVQPLDRA